jgi:thiamine pyrophosphokinase
MSKILIIGNARLEDLTKWSKLIEKSDLIIACDGAMKNCVESNIAVDFLIGDMDSIGVKTLQYARSKNTEIFEISDQQNNDLSKAISFAQSLSPQSIEIIGVDGGRSEHQFANYFSLIECQVNTTLHLDDCIVIPVNKSNPMARSIELEKEFSVFSIGQSFGVNLSGGKWEINDADLTPSSIGLHNVAVAEKLMISCSDGNLLVFINR